MEPQENKSPDIVDAAPEKTRKPRTVTRPRIDWTADEYQQVVRVAWGHYQTHSDALAALRVGNQSLPEARRRPANIDLSHVTWFKDCMQRLTDMDVPVDAAERIAAVAHPWVFEVTKRLVRKNAAKPVKSESIMPPRHRNADEPVKDTQPAGLRDADWPFSTTKTPAEREAIKAAAHAEPVEAPPEPSQPPAPPPAPEETFEPTSEPLSGLGAEPYRVPADFRRLLVAEFADIFAEAMVQAMGRAFTKTRAPEVAATPGKPPEAPAFKLPARPATVKKPSVLIVGLRGSQKSIIDMTFGAKFDLRFVGGDESKDHLRNVAEKSEFAFVMTDFIDHSREDIVRSRNANTTRQSGGMTALKETLADLAKRVHTEAA